MTRSTGFLLATLLSAALVACASPPKGTSILAGGAAQDVLILPLNATAPMSPELEALRALVWSELEVYLRAEGKQLRSASAEDTRRLWLRSIQQVRAGDSGTRVGFDDAARLLVLELAKHAEFDTVIIPSLFIREATITGDVAGWDGVERALEFAPKGRDDRGLAGDTTFVGVAPAASLHVVVLDAVGNKLQEATGGLELLVRVVVATTHNAATGRQELKFAPRKGPYSNTENVREGIALALAPFFLPPLPSNAK